MAIEHELRLTALDSARSTDRPTRAELPDAGPFRSVSWADRESFLGSVLAPRMAGAAANVTTVVLPVGACPIEACRSVVYYTVEDDTRVRCDECGWEGWDEQILGNPRTGAGQ